MRVLAAHLREAEVHCCGKLQAFRPRLLRRGAQDAADFVDLIRLEQAQQGGGHFSCKLNVVNASLGTHFQAGALTARCKAAPARAHTSDVPGNKGRSVYSSAMMTPVAKMSIGAL